jgi:hypothetical protein
VVDEATDMRPAWHGSSQQGAHHIEVLAHLLERLARVDAEEPVVRVAIASAETA